MQVGRLIELEAVLAVAHRRSFRAAAVDLGLSTTALSQIVAGLESRLGVRLFNRTTRSVAPTAAGDQFVVEITPALAAIRSAVQTVGSHQVAPSGLLRLNTSLGAARRLLSPLILEYLRRYPEMSVDLVTEGKLVDIVKDGYDAGFRLAEQVPRDMIAIPLRREERLVLVAAPAYLDRHPPPDSPHALSAHDCIRMRLPSGILYRWEFERGDDKPVIDAGGRLTLDESSLIHEAALAGQGIAYLSEWDVAADIRSGRLVQLLDDWTPAFPGLCLYYPGRRQLPAGLRAMIDLIRERYPEKSAATGAGRRGNAAQTW